MSQKIQIQKLMNKELISIIVAIYKVEKWLPKCIDSILSQTYNNIEIILVDDGSTDNSGKICDEYAMKDSRIKVIHKQNGGQSTARNAAIDIAKGKYIGFIDGDDWIEPNMYEVLLTRMKESSVDIVQCGWHIWNGMNMQKDIESKKEILLTSDEALDNLATPTSKEVNTSVCCKLFKREIIGITRFTPVRAYEDDEFVFRTVGAANNILCISSCLYNYNQHENSTMTSKFSLNRIALVTIQNQICNYIKERRPQLFNGLQKTLCSKQFYILYCLIHNNSIIRSKKEAKKIYDSIITSYDDYMNNPLMGKNKFMLFVLKYFPSYIWREILNIYFR